MSVKINPEKIKEILNLSVIKAFEEMSFIDVIPSEPIEIQKQPLFFIDFKEPLQGSLFLMADRPCKELIIQNIFAQELTELDKKIADDCLLELVNVIGGLFIRSLLPEQDPQVGIPSMLFNEEDIKHQKEYKAFYYEAEGTYFKIGLRCIA